MYAGGSEERACTVGASRTAMSGDADYERLLQDAVRDTPRPYDDAASWTRPALGAHEAEMPRAACCASCASWLRRVACCVIQWPCHFRL